MGILLKICEGRTITADSFPDLVAGAYTACGCGATYLWVAAACSVGSLCYVLTKAVAVFGAAADGTGLELQGKGQVVAVEAMFLMSLGLVAAHLAMAYRASSRERRRLHVVYRIDIEAIAERLSKLEKEGWRPRRTIIVCSWDAEEFALIGSTKWVEDNMDMLASRAIAYLNVDISVFGPGELGSNIVGDSGLALAEICLSPSHVHTLSRIFRCAYVLSFFH